MGGAVLKCPVCGAILAKDQYKSGLSLTCPGCSKQLRISRWYLRLSMLCAAALTVALCLLFGMRGLRLLGTTAVLWLPIGLVWNFFLVRIIPLKFEIDPSDDRAMDLFRR